MEKSPAQTDKPASESASASAGEEVFTCRICLRTAPHKTYPALELLYRTLEPFKYFECSACGCVQHAEMPEDLSRYYPSHYYSYQPPGGRGGVYQRLKDVLEAKRNRYAFYGKGLIGRFFQAALPEPALTKLAQLNPGKDTRILDVGSGAGRFLNFLAGEGFRALTGIDPFIAETLRYPNGLRILKQDLMETEGRWDIIMFNHSFEHIPDNLGVLRKAGELLDENGWCVIEVPTASSWAWRHYGIYWNGLDAPRHLFLHTLESFRVLADRAGLVVKRTLYNSQAAQFWWSENFRRGISHFAHRNRWEWFSNRVYRSLSFLPQHLRAQRLNREGRGDCVAFFLQKKPDPL